MRLLFLIIYSVTLVAFGDGADKSSVNLEELEQKALEGDYRSQHLIAFCYANGEGVDQNLLEARKWYQILADSGDFDGMLWIGRCYKNGTAGIEQDFSTAYNWFNKCVQQSSLSDNPIEPIVEILQLYQVGDVDFSKNKEKELEWVAIADRIANEGHERTLCYLAEEYLTGDAFPRDVVKALEMFERSGSRGWFHAMVSAAAIYYEGKVVPVDRAMAREWIEKMRQYRPDLDPVLFARHFSESAYGEALAWASEETTVAEELDQLYEQAFFLETAKGQRQDALRLYRQIINTKATNGTNPVIAKTLRRMLEIYENPDVDPLNESIRLARYHLSKCREFHLLPGVFSVLKAHRTMESVPELSALDDLVDIYDQAMKDILKRDEKYRSASEKIDLGLISQEEYTDALHSARRKYENIPEYISALQAYEHYCWVRNIRLFEYLIDQYELEKQPFPVDWINREQELSHAEQLSASLSAADTTRGEQ